MITSGRVGLRARIASDVEVLHAELHEDVATRVRAASKPWRPTGPADSPYAVTSPSAEVALFSVIGLASGDLAGEAVLTSIDSHNRNAHLGTTLRPSFRGRHLSTDVVRALCVYGFDVLGLHRLQVETLADNAAMLAAAKHAGFVQEGIARQAAWVYGQYSDEVILGLLADNYRAHHRG